MASIGALQPADMRDDLDAILDAELDRLEASGELRGLRVPDIREAPTGDETQLVQGVAGRGGRSQRQLIEQQDAMAQVKDQSRGLPHGKRLALSFIRSPEDRAKYLREQFDFVQPVRDEGGEIENFVLRGKDGVAFVADPEDFEPIKDVLDVFPDVLAVGAGAAGGAVGGPAGALAADVVTEAVGQGVNAYFGGEADVPGAAVALIPGGSQIAARSVNRGVGGVRRAVSGAPSRQDLLREADESIVGRYKTAADPGAGDASRGMNVARDRAAQFSGTGVDPLLTDLVRGDKAESFEALIADSGRVKDARKLQQRQYTRFVDRATDELGKTSDPITTGRRVREGYEKLEKSLRDERRQTAKELFGEVESLNPGGPVPLPDYTEALDQHIQKLGRSSDPGAEAVVKKLQRRRAKLGGVSTKTKSPSATAREMYNRGKLAREKYGDEGAFAEEFAMRDPLTFPDPSDDVGFAFWQAGFSGGREPQYVRGWRYGDIPESGASKNYATGETEAGVSLAGLGDDLDDNARAFRAISSGDKDIVDVEGWLIEETGSDGEPLIVGAKKAAAADTPGLSPLSLVEDLEDFSADYHAAENALQGGRSLKELPSDLQLAHRVWPALQKDLDAAASSTSDAAPWASALKKARRQYAEDSERIFAAKDILFKRATGSATPESFAKSVLSDNIAPGRLKGALHSLYKHDPEAVSLLVNESFKNVLRQVARDGSVTPKNFARRLLSGKGSANLQPKLEILAEAADLATGGRGGARKTMRQLINVTKILGAGKRASEPVGWFRHIDKLPEALGSRAMRGVAEFFSVPNRMVKIYSDPAAAKEFLGIVTPGRSRTAESVVSGLVRLAGAVAENQDEVEAFKRDVLGGLGQ